MDHGCGIAAWSRAVSIGLKPWCRGRCHHPSTFPFLSLHPLDDMVLMSRFA